MGSEVSAVEQVGRERNKGVEMDVCVLQRWTEQGMK